MVSPYQTFRLPALLKCHNRVQTFIGQNTRNGYFRGCSEMKWKVSSVTMTISLDQAHTQIRTPFFLFHYLILFCFAFWCSFLCYLYGMFSNLSVLDTSFKMIADDCSKNHDNFRAYIWGWVNKRKRKKPGGSSLQLFCFLFSYKLFGLLLDFSESLPWLLWLESRNCNKPGSTIGQQKN